MQVREQILAIAAHVLEAAPEDLDIVEGFVHVVGTPVARHHRRRRARKAYFEPAALPPGQPLGLEGHARLHAVVVRDVVERMPHVPRRDRSRHRCRRPSALRRERGLWRDDQPERGRRPDRRRRRAGDRRRALRAPRRTTTPGTRSRRRSSTTSFRRPPKSPSIEYGHVETHAPTNPGGHKGMGEGGAIGAPPAVINAIADALAPLGVQVRTQPLGPADRRRAHRGGAHQFRNRALTRVGTSASDRSWSFRCVQIVSPATHRGRSRAATPAVGRRHAARSPLRQDSRDRGGCGRAR